MIPTFVDLVAGYEAWSGDRTLREKEPLVSRLLEEAWTHQPEPADEPAVLFFVFCRHWYELGEHCTAFIDWIAVHQLDLLGLPVRLDLRELRELRLDTCAKFAQLDDVQAWFAEQYASQLD